MFSKQNLGGQKKSKKQNGFRDFFIPIKHITKVFIAQVYKLLLRLHIRMYVPWL